MKKIYNSLLKFIFALLMVVQAGIPMAAHAFNFWNTPSDQTEKQAFWYQFKKSFVLSHYANAPQVQQQIQWYQEHQAYVSKILENASPYLYYIYSEVAKRKLPGELALLPVIESAYDPFAYSNRGAAGLWQLMPGTATGYGLKLDWWYDGRRDIYASTHAALNYLAYLGNFFDGNWLYAIAAYDAGEGTVQQAINSNAHNGHSTSFWNLPLPKETHSYVPRLLALAAIISNPDRYHIDLPDIKNGPYFAPVNVGTQIDLAHAAKLAGISLKELYTLNPGYNRWATDPKGPHRLLLPVDKIDQFKNNLANIPVSKRVSWQRYRVQHGDTLGGIAKKFRAQIPLLQEINKLNGTLIHPGQILLIPGNASSLSHYDFTQEVEYARTQQIKLGPKKQIITVEAGDSLWKIAKRYQIKVSEIRFWNHLSLNQKLTKGQKLILWIPQESHLPDSIKKEHFDLLKNYKVQAGDNLSSIAHKFKVPVGSIKALNHLHQDMIHPGQTLKIPPMPADNGKKKKL